MTLSRPRESTIRRLFAVSMNRCAFPGCDAAIVDSGKNVILGEVCHICAVSVGGPRYDPTQSGEERHGFENLMLMCRAHHTLVDDRGHSAIYTVEYLAEAKRKHEVIAVAGAIAVPQISDEQVRALLETAVGYSSGAVHMDFRDTVIRVGGEGGLLGGGGGGGGVLTIVGSTRPPEAALSLSGTAGQAPGGGGGGAGGVDYVGRPVTDEDLRNGFRISSFFPVNAYHHSGLIHVLGAGWEYYTLREIPTDVQMYVVAFVELGSMAPETLLQLEFSARDPEGQDVVSVTRDVAVPMEPGLTPRAIATAQLQFRAGHDGVWTLRVSSSTMELSVYALEVRRP